MARRELPFDTATNLAIVGPLTPEAIGRVSARFHAWAASPSGETFRFRRGVNGWLPVTPAELSDRVERSIVRVREDLHLAEIEALARELEYDNFATILILTDRFVGLSSSHAFSDGPAALGPLRAVLSGNPEVVPRLTRFPLLLALAATRQLHPFSLRAGRDFQRTMHAHFAGARLSTPGQATDASTLALSYVRVDGAAVRASAARARDRDSSSSLSTLDVLSSAAFRAFRACLAEGTDLPIRMLVGLRQHLPRGLSTRGNFSTNAVLGTLRERNWTATETRDAMSAVLTSPILVASHAVDALLALRGRVRRVLFRAADEASGSPIMLTYNVLTGRLGADRDDFVAGEPQVSTLMMLNRGPVLGPHCTVTATGTDFLITTLDDAGVLDLAKFDGAIRAELAS